METNAKQELYSFVEMLRCGLRLNFNKYPISTTDICDKSITTELLYHNFSTRGICGTALIGEKSNTIILNNKRNDTEQNFDCGHEIIHCTKHNDCEAKCFNCFEAVLPEQNGFLEWEANEGSAELLVPYKMLLPIILRNRQILSSPSRMGKLRADLARDFSVSSAIIFYRLESLKYEISQYLNGVSLDEIELISDNLQKQKGINARSLNNFKRN